MDLSSLTAALSASSDFASSTDGDPGSSTSTSFGFVFPNPTDVVNAIGVPDIAEVGQIQSPVVLFS